MRQTVDCQDEYEVDGVSVSPLLGVKKTNKHGSVAGLPDEELAEPDELERVVYRTEWGPILALPARPKASHLWPAVDECGGVDWGAFGTVDFERTMPEPDKARYKADRLREKLKDVMIMIGTISERLSGKAKYLVLKYVRMGVIELEHIVNDDMLALAKYHLRARGLREEIAQLQEASRKKRRRELAVVLG